MSNRASGNIITDQPLFDILKTGEYKKILIPNYFPEVQYMEEDDTVFMRSTMYIREDLTPAFYWYLAFTDDGEYKPEATSGYIALSKNSNLLHIKAMHRVSYDDINMRHDTYEGISVVGCYSLQSNEYTSNDNGKNSPVFMPEYGEDGSVVKYGSVMEESSILYAPATDTANAQAKAKMLKVIDQLKEGNLRLPDPY
jgi:hypothetical protein